MSHFPKMLLPPDAGPAKFARYVLHVARHGVLVVYKIGDDGVAENLVAGPVAEVIGIPLQEADPDAFVVTLPSYYADTPRCASRYGFQEDFWSEVAQTLNGKSGPRRSYAEATYRCLIRLNVPLLDLLSRPSRAGGYQITDVARAADEGYRAKQREG